DTGLLTAEDVANLDLHGCELVVLSACETGLGDVTISGEGVLGLQRAFHAAGARSLAASLWSVNDAATSVLMEEFYARLLDPDKPLGKLEALRQAQLFVLKHPEKVVERRQELEKALEQAGLPKEGLRGPKGKAALELPDGGKIVPGESRSPVAWWAGFVLSGDILSEDRRSADVLSGDILSADMRSGDAAPGNSSASPLFIGGLTGGGTLAVAGVAWLLWRRRGTARG